MLSTNPLTAPAPRPGGFFYIPALQYLGAMKPEHDNSAAQKYDNAVGMHPGASANDDSAQKYDNAVGMHPSASAISDYIKNNVSRWDSDCFNPTKR